MALTGEMTAQGVARRYTVPSSEPGRKPYEVIEWKSGCWSCNCMDWTRRCTKATDHSRATGMHCKHIRKIMRDFDGGKSISFGTMTLKNLLDRGSESFGRNVWNKGLPDKEIDQGQRDKPWYVNWDVTEVIEQEKKKKENRLNSRGLLDLMLEKGYFDEEVEIVKKWPEKPKSKKVSVPKDIPLPPSAVPRARPIARLDEEV